MLTVVHRISGRRTGSRGEVEGRCSRILAFAPRYHHPRALDVRNHWGRSCPEPLDQHLDGAPNYDPFTHPDDPTRHVLLLAALGGTMQSLSEAIDRNMGEQLSMPMILLLAAAIGSIFGVLSVLLGSYAADKPSGRNRRHTGFILP